MSRTRVDYIRARGIPQKAQPKHRANAFSRRRGPGFEQCKLREIFPFRLVFFKRGSDVLAIQNRPGVPPFCSYLKSEQYTLRIFAGCYKIWSVQNIHVDAERENPAPNVIIERGPSGEHSQLCCPTTIQRRPERKLSIWFATGYAL